MNHQRFVFSTLLLSLSASQLATAGNVDLNQVCLNLTAPANYSLPAEAQNLPNPVMFVTQMPLSPDMRSRMSAFGHHEGGPSHAGRGGDLYIVHPSSAQAPGGCLRNLTREAGFGEPDNTNTADPLSDVQGNLSIAVREPYMNDDGNRALFSMVIGAPLDGSGAQLGRDFYWQIYEISNLGLTDEAVISKLPHQPIDYNHVSPMYHPDQPDVVLMTSDLPMGGPENRHLYPPRDEYEFVPTVMGIWELDMRDGVDADKRLTLVTHNPSGAFTPFTDSYGRLLFSSWDHLQRDIYQYGLNGRYSWNLSDESANAVLTDNREYFPQYVSSSYDPLATTPHPVYGQLNKHSIKLFFLWELNRLTHGSQTIPYSGMEIINHLGRHQMNYYFNRRFDLPGNGLSEFTHPSGRDASLADGVLYPIEDPTQPGRFYFTDGQHFTKNGSGRILYFDVPPGRSPDEIDLVPVTSREDVPGGRYRDPLPLSDGQLFALHTPQVDPTTDLGMVLGDDTQLTDPNYRFTLRRLSNIDTSDPLLEAGNSLLPEMNRRLHVWGVKQGRMAIFDGAMSVLDPVEVISRTPTGFREQGIPAIEQGVFAQENVDIEQFMTWMKQRDLALIVSRNVTSRDDGDHQQPYNLFVQDALDGNGDPITSSDTGVGQLYPVQYLQLLQGDMIRINTYVGFPDGQAPDTPPTDWSPGRKILPNPMHSTTDVNPAFEPSDQTTVTLDQQFRDSVMKVAEDGSVAGFVPASRAMTWRLTDADGTGIVSERYWLTFQPGEIRVCASCHGLDTTDHQGLTEPENPPLALAELLQYFNSELSQQLFADGFE